MRWVAALAAAQVVAPLLEVQRLLVMLVLYLDLVELFPHVPLSYLSYID